MDFDFQHNNFSVVTYYLEIIETQETVSDYQNRAIEFGQDNNLNEIDVIEDDKIYDISPAVNIISDEFSQRFKK